MYSKVWVENCFRAFNFLSSQPTWTNSLLKYVFKDRNNKNTKVLKLLLEILLKLLLEILSLNRKKEITET